ncbi:MAG TPA: hypothetical protein VLJ11_11155 [Bryobacteraceae bacterium]|nr:hypothetical protein [Bryobacteraceae bacterium]
MASPFWIITDNDGEVRLINPDLIRFVDDMRSDHLLIHFDSDHVLELEGRAASETIEFLQRHAYLKNKHTADLHEKISVKPK